jgi:hypothetical protein
MYGFDGAAFDRWLTTDPREADAAAFEQWCELNSITWMDERGEAEAWEMFEQAMGDEYEDAMLARAEDREDAYYDTDY